MQAMKKLASHVLIDRRKTLNLKTTLAEKQFQSRLRRHGIRHYAQVVIGPFIADFVIPDRLLVIEIDGGIHSSVAARAYDAQRTEYLRDKGFSVVRVVNENVKTWPLQTIDQYPVIMGKRLKEYKRIIGELSNERQEPSVAMSANPTLIDCPF